MKIKTLLFIALAVLCCTEVSAQARKKRMPQLKQIVENRVQPVPADSFSYAMGVAQSEGLSQYLINREGIDSAYISYAAQGLADFTRLKAEDIKKQIAYTAGLRIGEMNTTQIIPSLNKQATGKADTNYVNLAEFNRGLAEGINGVNTLTPDSATKIAERQMKFYTQQLKETNFNWLEANRQKKGVKTTKSGLQYRILTEGNGALASDTSEVEVHYEGRLIDGTVFDSSYKRNQPATFRPSQVIKGWTEALQMMPEGSVWELYIPYQLAYGENGNQGIPPFATLIFKVELLKVKSGAITKK